MFGLDNLMDLLFDTAMESISRNERIIKLLKKLNLDPDHPPEDFSGVYQYALVEYGLGKPRPVLEIFRQSEIQQLFREALEHNTPSRLLKHGEAFLAGQALQAELQANQIDVRREFYEFAAVFIEVAKRTRTPAEILTNQKLESLHRQIGTLQNRLNRLPTLEGIRTEMARLTLPPGTPSHAETRNFVSLQSSSSSLSPSLSQPSSTHLPSHPSTHPLFALAQQMRGWFETLGFRFESHENWQEDTFEWIINIPVRRGRYDRILVRGIDGEAGLRDVESLKQAATTHRTDEGWLVTARRISRAARDEVNEEENASLGCFTLDELLDQDADFSGYLNWLESEIQKRGINQKYVPLACLKEEVDPDTQQRIGVSHYGDRDGWIEGYIDRWLDDPAKEHISVLGEFGTGKTWFALHYAWQALQRYREAQRRGLDRPRLPLVVPLRDYAKAVSVESLFSEFFFRKHEIPIPGYSAFEQLNRMGKLLLIFDGFDEMAARVDRQQMINNFWELAKVVVPGAKVILTCRTEHFPEAREGRALLNAELQASTKDLTGETPQFEVLELEKFNDEQIRQVLSHQARSVTVEQIMGNPELLDLARRPVLTELILEALPDIEAGKPVDMSRVYLYAVRHKMERDIKAERTFTSMADKLYFMCELSWEMLSSDRMSINYREFPDRIRKLFGPAVEEQKDLDHWHYDMMGQTMLIRNAEGDYSPAHRSLLEFFVAYKFAFELDILAEDFAQLIDQRVFLRPANLHDTFGKQPLSKAVTDLLLPILAIDKRTKTQLKNLIKSYKNNFHEHDYSTGNATNLLLSVDSSSLQNEILDGSRIVGADFTKSNLKNTSFKDATFVECIFTKVLGYVWSIKFSPDGSLLASSSSNGIVHLWDAKSHKEIIALKGHTNRVYAVAFSQDGKLLASAGADRTIRIWNIETTECFAVLSGHTDGIRSLVFGFNENWIFSGSYDHTIKVWNLQSQQCVKTLEGHTRSVWSLDFSQANKVLASGSEDTTIKLWNPITGECIRTLDGHETRVGSLLFRDSCQELISSSSDSVKVWDIHTGDCLESINSESAWCSPLSISSVSGELSRSNQNHKIEMWNINPLGIIETLEGHNDLITSLAFSPKEEILASGSADQTIKIWSPRQKSALKTLQGLSDWTWSVDFNHDATLLASGYDDGLVRIWDVNKKSCLHRFLEHRQSVCSVAFSNDGNLLASGAYDSVKLWNLSEGKCLKTLRGHDAWIETITFSPSNKLLASGSGDTTIQIWDVATGERLKILKDGSKKVASITFCHNDKILISGTKGGFLKIWELDTGECIRTIQEAESHIWSVTYSKALSMFAACYSDGKIRVFDAETAQLINILEGHTDWVHSIVFRATDNLLISASADQTIKVWDVLKDKCLKTLEGHTGPVFSVSAAPSNELLASGSSDRTVKLWNLRSGECLATLTDRLYEGMNITGVKGLTEVEKENLKLLGAIEV